MPDIMADIMAARPCDRPPEPIQRQEQEAAPSSPETMTPDCPAHEGDARHSQATLPRLPVAQGCSTARLSDTSARFRRPKVLGKRRKVESDKKKKKSPKKTRETSVGCPKPGSNRHVFKGHWILSPTRLPIPPFGHIQAVDFPLETSHFRCTSAALPLQRIAKLLNFLRYSKTFNKKLMRKKRAAKKRVIPLVRQKALIPDK